MDAVSDLPAAAITAAAEAIERELMSGIVYAGHVEADEALARAALEAAAPHITAAERARLTQPLDKTAGILRSQVAAALEAAWEDDGQDPAEAVMAVVRPVLETVAAIERQRSKADQDLAVTDAAAAERDRIRGPVATLTGWLEHLPQRHVPLRAAEALQRLQRLTAPDPLPSAPAPPGRNP